MTRTDRILEIAISSSPDDSVMGTLDLQPIVGADGAVIDHLVVRAVGVGMTLLFGDVVAARGRRLSELDPGPAVIIRRLLAERDADRGITLDLRLASRTTRVRLDEDPGGIITVTFARMDPVIAAARSTVDDAGELRIRRLRSMMSALTDGVVMYRPVHDPDGGIVDFVCVEMTDADPILPAAEQIGRPLLEMFPEAADNGVFDGYCRAMTSGEPWTPERQIYQRHDQRYVYRLRASVVGDHLVVAWRDTLVEDAVDTTIPTGERLTERQLSLLQGIADGRSTADIAAGAFLSPFTVRNEVRRILAKLGAHNRAEAVSIGLAQGAIVAHPTPT